MLEVRSASQGAIGSATIVLAASQAADLTITVGSQPAVSPAPTVPTAPAALAPAGVGTTATDPAAPGAGAGG